MLDVDPRRELGLKCPNVADAVFERVVGGADVVAEVVFGESKKFVDELCII